MPVKRCPKCGEEKELTEFWKCNSKKSPDGHQGMCRTCAALGVRQWEKDNPDRVKKHKAGQFQRHKSEYLEKKKIYRHENKENEKRISKKLKAKQVGELRNCYVIEKLKRNNKNIKPTPELIDLKREQITMYRELKTFKKEIKNGNA